MRDLDEVTLVERISTSRRGVCAMAFSPHAAEVAIATKDDLFVMEMC